MALLLSDQRMPGMTGVDFLERARELYPEARRVLLTAYADTEAAIRAINTARIHYYLNKPWDPPEEKLYPVLTDLLDDWKAGYRPPFEGLRVIGSRWSLKDHTLRTFCRGIMCRTVGLILPANEEAVKLLEERNLNAEQLPVVLFPDGSMLVEADPDTLGCESRTEHTGDAGVLRHGGGGRGPGGARGRRLRGQRGTAHAGHRARSSGWPGGLHFAN